VTPSYVTCPDLIGTWMEDVRRGDPPVRYAIPEPFDTIDLRPGRLVLLGGAPGSGKTAAILQMTIDLLCGNPEARALVANVEMVPSMLLDRVASRLSAVPLTTISNRTLTPGELSRVRVALEVFAPVAPRLAFLDPPHSLEHVAAAAGAFGANVLIADYVQRFSLGAGKGDKREQLETITAVLRGFCDRGAVVLAAAAVARQKGVSGSSYRGLNLASFRGSSELEFGADACYLLAQGEGGLVGLGCVKNRYGPTTNILTQFDPTTQTFTPAPVGLDAFDDAAPAPEVNGRARGR
jgi:replicative DNA helicase